MNEQTNRRKKKQLTAVRVDEHQGQSSLEGDEERGRENGWGWQETMATIDNTGDYEALQPEIMSHIILASTHEALIE